MPVLRIRMAPVARAAAALLLVTVTGGCSGPVSLPDPAPAADARAVCARVMGALPETVQGQPRRKVRPGGLTAAWGDPPITLTCGGPLPSAMASDTRCFEVNGVGWYAEEGQGGWLFTTIGREVAVQLGVPARFAPEANALTDVARAISENDRSLQPCL